MSKKLCKTDKKEMVNEPEFKCHSCGRLADKKKKVCDPEPLKRKKK